MRLAIRIVVAAVATLTVALAHAHERRAETKRNFQIAAQPLSQALLEFSRQADVIVTAPSELVRNKRAPEIRGELTPSAALARLLRGSGLEASFTASGAITIGAARRFVRQRATVAATCERRRQSARRNRRCADRGSARHRAEAHRERAGRACLGQRVRQQARAATARDDDPRLRRLHSRSERQQRRRSGPDDDHAARHRAGRSGRCRRLLRRRHAARFELQLRRSRASSGSISCPTTSNASKCCAGRRARCTAPARWAACSNMCCAVRARATSRRGRAPKRSAFRRQRNSAGVCVPARTCRSRRIALDCGAVISNSRRRATWTTLARARGTRTTSASAVDVSRCCGRSMMPCRCSSAVCGSGSIPATTPRCRSR